MWDCKIDFKSDILQPKIIKSKKFEKELNKTPKNLSWELQIRKKNR